MTRRTPRMQLLTGGATLAMAVLVASCGSSTKSSTPGTVAHGMTGSTMAMSHGSMPPTTSMGSMDSSGMDSMESGETDSERPPEGQ